MPTPPNLGPFTLRRMLCAAILCLASCTSQPAPSATPAPSGANPTVFTHAAVASDHLLASNAGLEMLRKGGNAVDAAVATSFALSVVRPYSCGIGGGGFMVLHLKHDPRNPASGPIRIALDYRETAPASIRPDTFESIQDPHAQTHGAKAVCVPGNVAGLLHALDRYGTLPREVVLAPAIRLAESGFAADAHYVEMAQEDQDVIPWLKKDPARIARFSFLWERYLDRGNVKIGTRITVPEQARVLRLIAERGRAGFYEGDVADAIIRTVKNDGGFLTHEDLRSYAVAERAPLVSEFRGLDVITMPPPSSGGIVIAQLFDMLEARPDLLGPATDTSRAGGHNTPPYIHLITECFKHGFADRARWMGDPNFVNVPLARLLDPTYTSARAALINPARTLSNDAYGTSPLPPEDHGTSHLCVIDAMGNAVACTETINLIFGSLLCVPEYGFALNNEMDDFLTRRGEANAFGLAHAELNRPAPGKRPLSSMTPTIVWDPAAGQGGSMRLIVGGAGGPRIISGSAQAALNVLLFNMPAHNAVAAPRFHHQWQPDTLQLETALITPALEADLKAKGHTTSTRKSVGNITLIRAKDNAWDAASDPRKGGVPAGY
jgi:gamma-glutamyltranspeptidase / glutathione hydrolase